MIRFGLLLLKVQFGATAVLLETVSGMTSENKWGLRSVNMKGEADKMCFV